MWIVSSGFKAGYVPTVLFLLFFLLLLFMVLILFQIIFREEIKQQQVANESTILTLKVVSSKRQFLNKSILFLLIPMINIFIVAGVNILYDRTRIYNVDYELQEVPKESQISEDDLAATYSYLFALLSRNWRS
jgi:cell division protein FtsL